ncbi:MAG TPA: MFS transporter [Clostridia bacterium]|nr:MFS transporter [Clostridia bacterium]
MVFLVKIFANFGIYGMQTFGSSYMYSVLNLDPNIAMIATAVYFGGYLLMAIPIGAISDKMNKKTLFGIGLVGMMLGAAAILLFVRDFISLSVCCFFIGASSSVLDVMTIPYDRVG